MHRRYQGIRRTVLAALVLGAALIAHVAMSTPRPARAVPAALAQTVHHRVPPAAQPMRGNAARAAQAHILSHPRPSLWQRWDGVLHRAWQWATRAHPLSGRG